MVNRLATNKALAWSSLTYLARGQPGLTHKMEVSFVPTRGVPRLKFRRQCDICRKVSIPRMTTSTLCFNFSLWREMLSWASVFNWVWGKALRIWCYDSVSSFYAASLERLSCLDGGPSSLGLLRFPLVQDSFALKPLSSPLLWLEEAMSRWLTQKRARSMDPLKK